MRHSIFGICALAAACASHPSPPAAVAHDGPPPAPLAPVAPLASPAPVPAGDAYNDPRELHDPEVLVPLFAKDTRPSFPKATTNDRDCWRALTLSGDAKKDFGALVSSCGTPTGSVEYVAPAAGKLHHVLDKRDTFIVKIQGGLCYRFFGVADGTIKDLDILIERGNGDLVGDDRTNGPVAIIESEKNWCMDNDGDYQFKVEVDGPGTGNYEFGVWARPKS